MATPYLDFFGETPDDEEEQAAAAAAPKLPVGARTAANSTLPAQPRAPGSFDPRTQAILSGNLTGAKPSYYGLSLDPATAAESEQYKKEAHDAAVKRNGGFAGDLSRFAVGGAKILTNPINSFLGDYLPEEAQAVVGGPGYFAAAALDELGDQAIPGGSGTRGSNIIPGRAGTGGDEFYPSETIQSGGYSDGYRGVGNPRAAPTDASGNGPGGTGGTPGTGNNPTKPGSYRTDKIDPYILSLLDAEKRTGPSEAEALLHKATDRAAANALGIAAGARGGAGARERAGRLAVTSNVAAGAEASQNVAALRAREDTERRARQSALVSMYAQNAGQGDARDLGYYQSDADSRTSENIANAANDLARDRYNADAAPGLLDDPFAWLFNRATGTDLNSKKI